ncbi:hypothetical protein K439DRAFT_1526109 [Ramaria rubella]|nr:hypothetical protein K439DRAFT_1526109 [Ramaria rubella]
MSSQAELAALIQEQSDQMAFTYVDVAAFTYDTPLTFPSEVRFIWHKKFRLGTGLYLLAHYPTLLQLLLNVYLDFSTFPSLQTNSLLFARAYAISSHNKLVFVVLALLDTTANVLFLQTLIAYPPLIFFLLHTLNGVFTILFDTVVFVAIIENTLGLLQLQRGIPGLQRNSLSELLVQQASTATDKVLRYDHSVAVILICHFHLDLQQRNDHPNGSNTSHSLPLGSFHAVTERIHRAVVDEFGDLSFNECFGTEAPQEDIELQDMQSPSGVAGIGLQEFPWAGGDNGDEEAGPVASGHSQISTAKHFFVEETQNRQSLCLFAERLTIASGQRYGIAVQIIDEMKW